MENSRLWLLNHKDLIKAGVMLVLSSVLGLILSALQNGVHIDWTVVGTTALITLISYLLKQLGTGENGNVIGTTALVEKLGASKESNK